MSKNRKFFDTDLVMQRRTKTGDLPKVIFIVSRVRGAGKTYGLCKMFLDNYFTDNMKFVFLVRFNSMLGSVAKGRLGAVLRDRYPEYTLSEVVDSSEAYSNIYLTKQEGDETIKHLIGYGVSINASSKIKELSSMFYDVSNVHLDEFIPSDGKYVPQEIDKLLDVMISIQRGSVTGESSRHVPLILSGNAITPRNMYFYEFGLYGNVDGKTWKWANDHTIYHRFESKEIQEERKEGIAAAVVYNKNVDYESEWVDEGSEFDVCTPENWGRPYYCYTVIYNKVPYGVRYYRYANMYYISATTEQDGMTYKADVKSGNFPRLQKLKTFKYLQEAFNDGSMRFSSVKIRDTWVNEILRQK